MPFLNIQSGFRALCAIVISCSAILAQSAPVRYTRTVQAGQPDPNSDWQYFPGYYTAIGGKGEIYVGRNTCIFRIALDGSISKYAGICGVLGKSDDGGPATKAALWSGSIAADQLGNLYIPEWSYNRIRKVAPDGTISTLTGTGADGCTGDGGLAVNAAFGKPFAMAVDTKGTIYANCGKSIRRISPDGKITTLIVLRGEDPYALACDRAGNVYAMATAGGLYGTIHRISPDGTDVVIAGAGSSHEDGVSAFQSLIGLSPIAVDADGNVYLVEEDVRLSGPLRRSHIRKIDKAGIIATIAGNGVQGTVGDGGPVSAASLYQPIGLAIDSNGNLVFEDSGRVRRILLKATPPKIELVASYYTATLGDGPRAAATFGILTGIARDKSGNLYVSDFGYSRIRRIGTDDMVTTFAGNASFGFDGDGDATAHSLFYPYGIDFDSQGNLWIGDAQNFRLRKVTPSGRISTEAETGPDGAALVKVNPLGKVLFVSSSTLFELSNGKVSAVNAGPFAKLIAGMTFDAGGSTYLATNNSIQKIDNTGVVTTFAGAPGKKGTSGDGGPATSALLDTPHGLTSDVQGNIYFIDGYSPSVIRKISLGGALIETVAAASDLTDLVIDPVGVIYATSYLLYEVFKFTPVPADGISILSGDRQIGSVGTQLSQPLVVAIAGGSGQLPFAGVTVQFKIASGAAKLSADSAITAADGNASVAVTLGSQTGPVVVTASVPGLTSVNFTLTAQGPCSFTLDQTNISVPSAGAYGTIALAATPAVCLWSAASRVTWVTLTAPATGTGNATIVYVVAPNPGPARSSILLIAGTSVPVSQQAGPPGPLISPAGVVSAGSNLPLLAPGALATIYGKNLTRPSDIVANASTVPLPTSLGGATVSIGGHTVPLNYVSATQINFQVPYDTPLGTANVTVTANGIASTAAAVTVAPTAPGVLTYGANWAVVQNQDYSVNGPSNPAKSGSYVTLYGTGAGAISPAVPTGAAAPALPLSTAIANVTASINGVPAPVTFAGLTPGNVGLLQVNLQVPALQSGTFPIQLTAGGVKSNAPSIAVLQ